MAQFILSDEELEIIYEALLTEIKEWEDDLEIAKQKGRKGDFELEQLKLLYALLKRISPYIK